MGNRPPEVSVAVGGSGTHVTTSVQVDLSISEYEISFIRTIFSSRHLLFFVVATV